ncbi:lantibiotic dehydratase [Mucilaginibacter limnophilus]|nr:lantibiotic dehydratase [Mucilaginibacter limnophilus]
MPDHHLSDFMILRQPAAPASAYSLDPEQILRDDDFLNALSVAVPQFYASLKEGPADARVRHTLLKYYNRFCFRPTPFGLFSAITPTSWQSPKSGPVTDHVFIQLDNHLAYQLRGLLMPSPAERLEPNPTLYQVQQEHRFIRSETDNENGRRQYLLQATDHTTTLKSILRFCASGQTRNALLQHIRRVSLCDEPEAKEYLDFLADAQVLLPVNRPNITDRDDLLRLSDMAAPPAEASAAVLAVQQLLQFCGKPLPYRTQLIKDLNETAQLLKAVENRPERPVFSIIRLRSASDDREAKPHKESLHDGLFALSRLSQPSAHTALQQFIRQFNERFEGQTVPLLRVLDPETGIGYQAPEAEKGNALLETVIIAPRQLKQEQISWNTVHQVLLNAWHRRGHLHRQPLN